jgi:hypothetical protein
MPLNKNALGLSLGTFFAVGSALYVITALVGWYSSELIQFVNEFHIFDVKNLGSVVLTMIEHFVYGYVGGFIFAALYNWIDTSSVCLCIKKPIKN